MCFADMLTFIIIIIIIIIIIDVVVVIVVVCNKIASGIAIEAGVSTEYFSYFSTNKYVVVLIWSATPRRF